MTRSLRADAQANYDRLLEVAARAFSREGADASLKAIAAEAGVGIGTLYRRFPRPPTGTRPHGCASLRPRCSWIARPWTLCGSGWSSSSTTC